MKIVVGGPPYSGKSRMAEELAKYYCVPCLCIGGIIEEMSPVEEDWNQYAEVGPGDVPAEVLREMVHRKLSGSHSCQTHGWVLDGFPATDAELRSVFCDQLDPEAEPPEGEAAEALGNHYWVGSCGSLLGWSWLCIEVQANTCSVD